MKKLISMIAILVLSVSVNAKRVSIDTEIIGEVAGMSCLIGAMYVTKDAFILKEVTKKCIELEKKIVKEME